MATVLYMSMPLDGFIAGRGIFEPAGDVDDHAGVRILVGEARMASPTCTTASNAERNVRRVRSSRPSDPSLQGDD